jgi:hypothetical protein
MAHATSIATLPTALSHISQFEMAMRPSADGSGRYVVDATSNSQRALEVVMSELKRSAAVVKWAGKNGVLPGEVRTMLEAATKECVDRTMSLVTGDNP